VTTPSERDVLLEKYGSVAGARITEPSSNFVPMLAALSEVPFTKTGWIYEPKMDGIRGITVTAGGKCKVLSRRNLDLTSQYPGIASELPALLSVDAVLDGEIIALNETGRPSFQHLQQRMNLTRETDVLRAEQLVPAYYFVFDVIQVGRVSLLGVKLAERKKILGEILQQSPRIKLLQHFDDDGVLAYHACVENGFEGIVAKRLDSYYEPGRRSPSWIKLKANQTAEFVLGGYTPGDGWRSETFGSLLMGYYDDNGKLHYAGSVGSGFDDRLLHETMRRIAPLRSTKCPFIKKPADKRDALWLEPGVIVEVKFMDWTRDGHLRTPVFLRFRDDKVLSEIRREKSVQPLSTQSAALVVSTPGELDTLPSENNVARIVPLLSVAESPAEYTAQTAQDQKPLSLVSAETASVRLAGDALF
jgi:bifunctional non-homologous end joining protein LigD